MVSLKFWDIFIVACGILRYSVGLIQHLISHGLFSTRDEDIKFPKQVLYGTPQFHLKYTMIRLELGTLRLGHTA